MMKGDPASGSTNPTKKGKAAEARATLPQESDPLKKGTVESELLPGIPILQIPPRSDNNPAPDRTFKPTREPVREESDERDSQPTGSSSRQEGSPTQVHSKKPSSSTWVRDNFTAERSKFKDRELAELFEKELTETGSSLNPHKYPELFNEENFEEIVLKIGTAAPRYQVKDELTERQEQALKLG
ncbi:hypothetical protein DXG01_002838 [Tephrocybe rancida]|nr:hypothetical protein DXG01_002838 [Tephrocybe rancida]